MNLSITKRQVRDALGQTTDASVARFFGVSTAAVAQWSLDAPIPARRALQAVVKRPDLFGALTEAAANDDVGPGAEEHGNGVSRAGVDVKGPQGGKCQVHGAASSAKPTPRATMIGGADQGGVR